MFVPLLVERRTHFYAEQKGRGGEPGGVTSTHTERHASEGIRERDVKMVTGTAPGGRITGDSFFFTFPLLSQVSEISTNDCTLVTIKQEFPETIFFRPSRSPSVRLSLTHQRRVWKCRSGRASHWKGRGRSQPCPLLLNEGRPNLIVSGKPCSPVWRLSKRTTLPSSRGSFGAGSPMDRRA